MVCEKVIGKAIAQIKLYQKLIKIGASARADISSVWAKSHYSLANHHAIHLLKCPISRS